MAGSNYKYYYLTPDARNQKSTTDEQSIIPQSEYHMNWKLRRYYASEIIRATSGQNLTGTVATGFAKSDQHSNVEYKAIPYRKDCVSANKVSSWPLP
jgi:hypothetical protein